MSRRTAQASRAIAEAWEKERQLVREGKGTRDWTRDEQEDILATGKAHDANGKAFEGHHMQSVSNKPEYQGEAGNIQFLSRDEHLAAHEGSYQNPTNGYYDYKNGKTIPFEGDRFTPCETIYLSDPVCLPEPIAEETGEAIEEKADNAKENQIEEKKKCTGETTPNASKSDQTSREPIAESTHESANADAVPKQDTEKDDSPTSDEDLDELEDFDDSEIPDYLLKYLSEEPKRRGFFGRILDKIDDFRDEHPIASSIIEGLGHLAGAAGKLYIDYKVDSMMEDAYHLSEREPGIDNPKHADDNAVPSVSIDIPDEDASGPKRASPREHTVNDPGQHYWKGGERVWIPKKPYRRGGKKNDETEDD